LSYAGDLAVLFQANSLPLTAKFLRSSLT